MTRATSPFTDLITIHAGADHRAIAPGAEVDLDEVLADGQTIAHHLGVHASAFVAVPVKPSARPSAVAKTPKLAPADVPADKE